MVGVGKLLIMLGGIFIAVGALLMLFERIPFLGKLPGDFHIKKDNVEFYFPLATSIILSLLLTSILWLVGYFAKKD